MGLDMYLRAKQYYSPAEYRGEENNKKFEELKELGGLGDYLDEYLPSISLDASVGYWRKANHIHRWFVENVQGGEDECQEHYVERSQLVELKGLCAWVLDDPEKASKTLPTQSGFFFGGEEYDEWYLSSLKETVEMIDKCLKMPDEWEFYYQSSW